MTLWYANRSAPRDLDNGKFHRRAHTGVSKLAHVEHQSWSYQFSSQQVGTSVRRTTYSATIFDADGHRVDHLGGYSSLDQAGQAAREKIDELLAKIKKRAFPSTLGNIPKFPNAAVNQEK